LGWDFFVGYVLFEISGAIIVERLSARKWMAPNHDQLGPGDHYYASTCVKKAARTYELSHEQQAREASMIWQDRCEEPNFGGAQKETKTFPFGS